MDTASITGYQRAAAAEALTGDQGTVSTRKNELGMDDFFKLLTTQLISQDPLKPMEDTEFISQMANFSSLAQMENIAENMSGVRSQQESIAVMSLIGREIKAEDSDGYVVQGKVTRVEMLDGEFVPFVGNNAVPFSSIIEIRDFPIVETSPPSSEEESEGQPEDGI